MERVLRIVLALFLAVLLYMQAASIFTVPVPDSIRWYGDESWLMTEAVATVETGKLHHPDALSSTLSEPKSIIFISVPWLRTLVYGIPAYLLLPDANPVDVGRVVSFILGLILLSLVGWIVYLSTSNLTWGLSAALVLASSRSFFFASHSARYDLFTGLIVFVVVLWVASKRFGTASRHRRWFWLAFSLLLLALGLPVHLYFFLAVIGFVAFINYGAWKERGSWLMVMCGIIAATIVGALLQLLLTGSISIWNTSQHSAEIGDVARDIPLFKLLSLSAQLAVLVKNSEVAWVEAPWLIVAVPVLLQTLLRKSQRNILSSCAFTAIVVWYFFERPHPAYMMHMLPLVLAASVIDLSKIGRGAVKYGAAVGSVLLTLITVLWTVPATSNGARWTSASERALRELSAKIDRTNGKPLVMVEASANKVLLNDTTLRLMTTHFQFFPTQRESIEATMKQHSVDYAILFTSDRYGYDRNTVDPLVKAVKENGEFVDSRHGRFFDIGRDYGDRDTEPFTFNDAFYLYRMKK